MGKDYQTGKFTNRLTLQEKQDKLIERYGKTKDEETMLNMTLTGLLTSVTALLLSFGAIMISVLSVIL